MITVRRFVTSEDQPAKVHMYKPDVPNHWDGFYAIFRPDKDKFWIKKWFANDRSATFKKAWSAIPVKEAHEKWNEFLRNNQPVKQY